MMWELLIAANAIEHLLEKDSWIDRMWFSGAVAEDGLITVRCLFWLHVVCFGYTLLAWPTAGTPHIYSPGFAVSLRYAACPHRGAGCHPQCVA